MRALLRYLFVILALQGAGALAQQTQPLEDTGAFDPTGHWIGAIVKDGSVLPVEIQI